MDTNSEGRMYFINYNAGSCVPTVLLSATCGAPNTPQDLSLPFGPAGALLRCSWQEKVGT